jgi:hypothetical protein
MLRPSRFDVPVKKSARSVAWPSPRRSLVGPFRMRLSAPRERRSIQCRAPRSLNRPISPRWVNRHHTQQSTRITFANTPIQKTASLVATIDGCITTRSYARRPNLKGGARVRFAGSKVIRNSYSECDSTHDCYSRNFGAKCVNAHSRSFVEIQATFVGILLAGLFGISPMRSFFPNVNPWFAIRGREHAR